MARQSAVVGVGYSKILRDKGIDGRPLAVEASRTAIADAGLTVGDVDAVFEYAGIDAIAMGMGWKPDFTYSDDFLFGGTQQCAATMWKRSSVTAADIDVAELYDGFTHVAMAWVEAMGLCGVGEFGDWVDGGATIGPGGGLPLNTSGGQLAEGRLHGLGFLAEGVATAWRMRAAAGTRRTGRSGREWFRAPMRVVCFDGVRKDRSWAG
jgi:acetyl-CoA acetyltransferase